MIPCHTLIGTVSEILLLLATSTDLNIVNVFAPKELVTITVQSFDKEWEIYRVLAPDIVQVRRKELLYDF